MLETIISGTEEQEEEEEPAPALRPRSLHSRGPAILAEAEPAVESAAAEGPIEAAITTLEDTTNVETHNSVQPKVTLTLEEQTEVQPGSPSVLTPPPHILEHSPTTGLISGKVSITEVPSTQILSSSSEEHVDYSRDELDFGDEPAPSDTSKFSHILEEEMRVDVPETSLPLEGSATVEGISSIPLVFFLHMNIILTLV